MSAEPAHRSDAKLIPAHKNDQILRGRHISFPGTSTQRPFDNAHTVTTSTGEAIRFEQTGDRLSIYKGSRLIKTSQWTPDGPEPLAEPANALAADAVRQAATLIVASAITLYNWLNSRPKTAENTDGSVPVLAFRAREYQGSKFMDLSYVGERSKDEVKRACPKYQEVQSRAASAVMAIREEERLRGASYSPQTFGTKVHKHLENQIKVLGDPNFVAEMSIDVSGLAKPGARGSIRTDAYNKVTNDFACIHDAKTGDAGITAARFLAIATRVKQLFKTTTSFVIIERRVPPK